MNRARRPTPSLVLAVGLGAAFAIAACGGDDADTGDTAVDTATTPDASELEDAEDATDTVAPPEDLAEPEDLWVEPRGFGEPCRDNRECTSGYCVPSQDGNVCTQPCVPSCPEGWVCGRVLDAGVDAARVCLDLATTLCQPCLEDDDCNLFVRGGENRCLDYGADGSFCGLRCTEEFPCSEGYTCVDDTGAPAEEGQCRRDTPCECNGIGKEFSLFTVCTASNDLGTCNGLRSCEADGLAMCSASAPTTETCNGLDDDCNGLIDEELPAGAPCQVENAFGSCPGNYFCTGGEERCVGQVPEAEICDGVDQDCDGATDEGFDDQDGDGIADCVDDDIDGDGTLNADDCGPLDPSRSKTATERCDTPEDDDCDGLINEPGAEGCEGYYRDVDRDGFGSDSVPARCLCAPDAETFHDADNAEDCNDLDRNAFPNATEVCNRRDDNCNDTIDEGVQAPCGGCVNLCLLERGPGTTTQFSIGGHAQNVAIDAAGRIQLAVGSLVGTYRLRDAGWPLAGTYWDVIFVDAETPGNGATSIRVRWRTATTEAGLSSAAWSPMTNTMPPASSPFWVEATGNHIEFEIELRANDVTVTPLVSGVTVLASEVTP